LAAFIEDLVKTEVETTMSQSTPEGFLKTAVKAVPSLKYAIGIGGIAAVIVLLNGFGTDLRVTGVGVLLIFVPMILLVLFSRIAAAASGLLQKQLRFLTWFAVAIFAVFVSLVVSSIFFAVPLDLNHWLLGQQVN